jgi:hypothetical protein
MKAKMLEIRDRGTFISALAVEMVGDPSDYAETWLLRRAGYGSNRCILLVDPRGHGRAEHDPYDWDKSTRTWGNAHNYIAENWDSIKSGDVIDVEFVLGESQKKKKSERFDVIDAEGKYHVAYEE